MGLYEKIKAFIDGLTKEELDELMDKCGFNDPNYQNYADYREVLDTNWKTIKED